MAEICEMRHTPYADGILGRGWWRGIQKRNHDLVLRVAQSHERDWAMNLNVGLMGKFIDKLALLYEKHSYTLDRIWSNDESGCQAGRVGGMWVLAKRGSRDVKGLIPKAREWMMVCQCSRPSHPKSLYL